MEKEPYTLRREIEKAKAEHLLECGSLDWQWYDERLVWTIMDYHSSKGSVVDFTADDEAVLRENGWTLDDVEDLCEREV